MTFEHVQEGDTVTRMLAGRIPIDLEVAHVDEEKIYCGAEWKDGEEYVGWTFDRKTGAEIEDDLMWGPRYGRTGSYLVHGETR